jgi:hypothetical protein
MNANLKYLIAVVAMISSVAHASAGDEMAPKHLTREQVRAEVMAARAAGELEINDTNYPLTPKEAPSTVTRADVRAELNRARIAGELDFNDTNYPLTPKVTSTLTREQVRTETKRARAAGELDWTDSTYPLTIHQVNGQ